MIGVQGTQQGRLFHDGLELDRRVRRDHPLRRIEALIDFDFVYREVEDCYDDRGNVSVPPPVILKLMVLLVFYNVRSERELMLTVPERLDWLWFLGFNLETAVPDHSVLSKARRRWGAAAGLVDGSKLFMDSSLIDADASNNSVLTLGSLKAQLDRRYSELERRLSESGDDRDGGPQERGPQGCGPQGCGPQGRGPRGVAQ